MFANLTRARESQEFSRDKPGISAGGAVASDLFILVVKMPELLNFLGLG